MNCEYCSTLILKIDRECSRCGAPIKNDKKVDNRNSISNPPYHQIIALSVQGGDRSFKVGTLWEISPLVYAISSNCSPYIIPSEWLRIETDDRTVLWRNSEGRIYCAKKGLAKALVFLKDNETISTEINISVE